MLCMFNKMSSAYRVILWCENQRGWTGALKLMECSPLSPGAVSDLSPFIKHYEGLSYSREDLHRRHLRARRDAQSQEHTLQLDLTAFHRWLRQSCVCAQKKKIHSPLCTNTVLLTVQLAFNSYLHIQPVILPSTSALFPFLQDFSSAAETWRSVFFGKFDSDHWKRIDISWPLPPIFRDTRGCVWERNLVVGLGKASRGNSLAFTHLII